MTAPNNPTNWFYALNNAQQGPVETHVIQSMLRSGQLSPEAMVWRDGMANWAPAGSVPELAGAAPSGGTAPAFIPPPPTAAPVGVGYATPGPIPMGYYTPRNDMVYVGFWWRVLSYLIDYIITAIPGAVIAFPIGFAVGALTDSSEAEAIASLFSSLVGFVIGWLYYALMESSSQQATVGKIAIGVRVTDLDGNRISFGRASGRFFGKILSGLILFIGFIMVGLTERKQGLHDQMAGTLVLKGRPRA